VTITLPPRTFALDSSAVLRLLDNEAGADEVRKVLYALAGGGIHVLVCALHWGEIAGYLHAKKGAKLTEKVLAQFVGLGIEVIPVTDERAERAALLQGELKIPYLGAFGVELAESAPCTFVTADYDLKPAAKRVQIAFLPKK
jgi:predicted nucleic acid-binding protein